MIIMNRFTLWYARLSRKTKIALIAIGVVIAVAACSMIVYMTLVPGKVEVRYGTVVKDPRCGYVFEDNTQTAWVKPSEVGDYSVEVTEQYCEQCEQEIQDELARRIEEEKELQESSGLEAMTTAIPEDQMKDLQALQSNIEVMKYEVVKGVEMANEISQTKSELIDFRNLVAGTTLPPELSTLESRKQELTAVIDMYIAACDLGLKAIDTGDLSYANQASDLLQQASAKAQELIAEFQGLLQ